VTHAYHESRHVQYCSKVKIFLERWWIRFGLGPLIVAAPAGLVSLYMSDEKGPHEFAAHFIPSSLETVLHAHPVIAYGFPFAWIYLCTLLYGLIDTLAKKKKLDIDSLVFLHRLLETIVESKAHRFGDYAKQLRGKTRPANQIFNQITQPEQQIALQVQGIHSFFSYLYPDVGIRVGLASIENDIPTEWFYWVPENKPPHTPIESLQSEHSTLVTCLRRRDMMIVEDTQAEARKENGGCFIHTREGVKDAECSLICYPVIDGYTSTISYVVNLATDRKDVLLEKNRDLYQWMFGHFALRMCLEHSLLTIKKSQRNRL